MTAQEIIAESVDANAADHDQLVAIAAKLLESRDLPFLLMLSTRFIRLLKHPDPVEKSLGIFAAIGVSAVLMRLENDGT